MSKTVEKHKIFTVVNFEKYDVVTSLHPKNRSDSEEKFAQRIL